METLSRALTPGNCFVIERISSNGVTVDTPFHHPSGVYHGNDFGVYNHDPDKKEQERLAETLKLNEPLSCAYYLKEDLRRMSAILSGPRKSRAIVLTKSSAWKRQSARKTIISPAMHGPRFPLL